MPHAAFHPSLLEQVLLLRDLGRWVRGLFPRKESVVPCTSRHGPTRGCGRSWSRWHGQGSSWGGDCMLCAVLMPGDPLAQHCLGLFREWIPQRTGGSGAFAALPLVTCGRHAACGSMPRPWCSLCSHPTPRPSPSLPPGRSPSCNALGGGHRPLGRSGPRPFRAVPLGPREGNGPRPGPLRQRGKGV